MSARKLAVAILALVALVTVGCAVAEALAGRWDQAEHVMSTGGGVWLVLAVGTVVTWETL